MTESDSIGQAYVNKYSHTVNSRLPIFRQLSDRLLIIGKFLYCTKILGLYTLYFLF
jgi:hypothetical protein